MSHGNDAGTPEGATEAGSAPRDPTRRPFDLAAAAEALRDRIEEPPEILAVLGSGLSSLAEGMDDPVEISFADVPGFPSAGVKGHAARYVSGRLEGRRVLMQAGRFHLYEGGPVELVCAPVRLAHALGAETVLLTNAAGGIARHLEPGSIMLLDDHVNLTWRSPLAGPVKEGEERFPDMSAPYDPELQAVAEQAALDLGIPLRRGVYAAMLGPSYETPAEIRMLQRLGVDAVGMSTVPEAITARARGMRVIAFSMITNRAAGLSRSELSHEEVLETGREAGATLGRLVRRVIAQLPPA